MRRKIARTWLLSSIVAFAVALTALPLEAAGPPTAPGSGLLVRALASGGGIVGMLPGGGLVLMESAPASGGARTAVLVVVGADLVPVDRKALVGTEDVGRLRGPGGPAALDRIGGRAEEALSALELTAPFERGILLDDGSRLLADSGWLLRLGARGVEVADGDPSSFVSAAGVAGLTRGARLIDVVRESVGGRVLVMLDPGETRARAAFRLLEIPLSVLTDVRRLPVSVRLGLGARLLTPSPAVRSAQPPPVVR